MTRIQAGVVLGAAMMLGACATTAPPAAPVFHRSEATAKGNFPFSDAVEVDGWLILAGQIGFDPATGKLVPGGIEPESRRTMQGIGEELARHGASFDDVVKCTVFLADIAEWGQFNVVYREFFKNHFPARSALGANGLALNARVEVECWARKPK